MRPPRSLVRQALALARIRQPLAGRIHRRRIAGRLVDVCPDCGVPLTAGACPSHPQEGPGSEAAVIHCEDCSRPPIPGQFTRYCLACGGRLVPTRLVAHD